jgi:hypothetical protein
VNSSCTLISGHVLNSCQKSSPFSLFCDDDISVDLDSRQVSLTTPAQTNARGLAQTNSTPTEENFLKLIESELSKVEKFTLEKVTELRQKIVSVEQALGTDLAKEKLIAMADDIAGDFLTLEKYVNINFMVSCLSMRLPMVTWHTL